MKLNKTRGSIIAGATTGALVLAVLGGSVAANAANSTDHQQKSNTTSSAQQRTERPAEEVLSGATADSVKAAVEAAYPGVTIDRMEKDADGKSVYEAHITKADGTHVTVMLDDAFVITGEEAMRAHAHGTPGDAQAQDTNAKAKKQAKKSAKQAKKNAKSQKRNA